MTSYADACVCRLVKSTGKLDAGNPHVWFDEGEGDALPTLLANFPARPGWILIKNLQFHFYRHIINF
jgi:hypothetical protein